jgi:hypothetical protein
MNPPNLFFVIINEQGHIIHSSTDQNNLQLMKKYVQNAQDSGDAWILIEYRFARVVSCDVA